MFIVKEKGIFIPNRRGLNTHEALQNVKIKQSLLRKKRVEQKREQTEKDLFYKIDRAMNQREARKAKRAKKKYDQEMKRLVNKLERK
jgi:hypothetical protein